MQILLTNDDGIHAPGLWALHHALAGHHAVTVVAPDRERSAVGHGITLHQPIRLESARVNGSAQGYAVSGTPADCVKLGLAELFDRRPDLVLSGINPGANVGVNVNYSGTVAAAKEAAIAGIPAIAVSIKAPGRDHLAAAARFAEGFSRQVMARGIPTGTFLNLNFPDLPMDEIRGVRWSRQGTDGVAQHFEKRRDPRDRTYYWQACDQQDGYAQTDVDGGALAGRFISVTPIKCDMTDYDTLRTLSEWEIPLSPDPEADR
ncbi:5'-nucleotidase SurE [Desulfosarcina ovata subsp. sediminis]|uniref:5'-nucleotidase SurE n=1 Tax=Desulfosarcina ovata subsp. sediminis TaxID=885957 RepID=A0A5K7ZQ27_9BACT|nr:5'/3'-nucleotidase SurE [Desulfosarcina ovata]BBO82149.1 5'-nucleotidase SurE [Desulfosarcina ovata subsp. sediminis]